MKTLFKRGLVALLPAALTLATFYFVFQFLYVYIGAPLGRLVVTLAGPYAVNHPWIVEWQGSLGFVLALVLTFCTGLLMATFLGKPLQRMVEALLKRVPIVKTIYPYAKQFTEFFMAGEKKIEFKAPVAIPFPDPQSYSIGFVTGDGLKHLNDTTGKHYLTVFVPTAPTPFTGFVVYIAREDVIPLPITTDEAMRLIITAGIVTPQHQMVPPGDLSPGGRRPLPAEIDKLIQEAKKGTP